MNWKTKEIFENVTEDRTQLIVSRVVSEFTPAQILFLVGEMGAGKTHFAKKLFLELGGDAELVSSPTFSLHQVYKVAKSKSLKQRSKDSTFTFEEIDHLDLSRLKESAELESRGILDLFEKKSGLIVIEWPELLYGFRFPRHWSVTQIEILASEENDVRQILWQRPISSSELLQ